jgi:hypothetical protein
MNQQAMVRADNLGDALDRYSAADLAQTIGGYRSAWKDLGTLVQDLDAVGYISDGSAHPWAPMVMQRLGHHLQHADHLTHLGHAGHTIHKLMHYLHQVMARHVNLEKEKRLWHAKSNVTQTMYWQSVAANTASTTATVRAPYSGVNYMVLDILMDTALTPPGFWSNISFASINFAQSGNTITYAAPGTGGVQGAGGQAGGMGFDVFLHDKTAPEGARGWNPWTGWILSSDAVSTWQWVNADPSNARSLFASLLMRSSPCDVSPWMQGGQQGQGTVQWFGYPAAWHQSGAHALDMMYAGVLGLSQALKGPPSGWGHGQHMGHPGNFGSMGPGPGVHPMGHAGPTGGGGGHGFT